MHKNSTPQTKSMTATLSNEKSHGPKRQTLDFLRQFARVYSVPTAGVEMILN